MDQIIDNLYVGGDADFERVKNKSKFSTLRCCKEGSGGHRDTLVYTTQGAPKGKNYLSVGAGDHLALNFIDPHDPHFIQPELIEAGLKFIHDRLKAGDKVLVACNAGRSRGPTTVMLYLRSIGELLGNFIASERMFRTICPSYDPGIGMRQFARTHWDTFENKYQERQSNE